VAGLETTATYDETTQTFTIDSPTIKAAKFWPGSLGQGANYAVVFARCISLGNDYGPMPFIVQIRDIETHEPLPGITVGDLGTKVGYNSVDNGFLMFAKVKVPRKALLARFTEINEDGSFEVKGDLRVLYTVMSKIRLQLTRQSAFFLLKQAKAAVRYAVCRRQFANYKDSKLERKLLDYQVHLEVLARNLATSIILSMAGFEMNQLHTESADFKHLEILHHLTSGVKALATEAVYAGLDEMRQSCGGAGFLLSSGVASWWAEAAPMPTFEGVNVVMFQ